MIDVPHFGDQSEDNRFTGRYECSGGLLGNLSLQNIDRINDVCLVRFESLLFHDADLTAKESIKGRLGKILSQYTVRSIGRLCNLKNELNRDRLQL